MSIKTDAIVIRDETSNGANTAARVGKNLVDIADDLVAKQADIDINSAKTGITPQQASDIATNNAKDLSTKQNTLVSATNIKTVNGESILGSGDLVIASGGGTWGSITGTLSDQTDLQAALDGIVAGSGAAASKEIKSDWNGVIDTWTVTVAPDTGHQLFANNVYLVKDVDYTVAGSVITYTTAPLASEVHTYFPNVVVPVDLATHTHIASEITDFDTEVSNNADVAANTAKTTNATHTGDVTGTTALTIPSTTISGKASVTTLSGTEEVLVNESGTLKKTTTQDIADLGGGGSTSPILQMESTLGAGISRYYYTALPIFHANGTAFYQTSVTNVPNFGTGTIGYTVPKTVTITSIKGVAYSHTGEHPIVSNIVEKSFKEAVADFNITAATATLTSTTFIFEAGDVGKTIRVTGAGASGAILTTTISSFTNANEVVLAVNASTTVASANGVMETNTLLYTTPTQNLKYASPTVIDITGLSFTITSGSRLFMTSRDATSGVKSVFLSLSLYE